MIDTVIFDIGNVLVGYDWKDHLNLLGFPKEEQEAIAKATALNEDWMEMDRGVLTLEECINRFISHAPQYAEDIRKTVYSLKDMIFSLPYTDELLRTLKKKGLKVYYLSNYGLFAYEATKDKLEFTKEMDGGIFSYEVKMVKPDRWIYEALLDKYNIDRTRAVFLDDTLPNVEAARECGLTAIHFTSYEAGMQGLQELGVL